MKPWRNVLLILGLAAAVLGAHRAAHALTDPATGGANGGPVTILFLSESPMMDPVYAEELAQAGFVHAAVSYWDPLTEEATKRFNVFVFDSMPQSAAEYALFGQKMIHFRKNKQRILQRIHEGAGLLVLPNLADGGGLRAGGLNDLLKPFGIRVGQSCVRDTARSVHTWTAYEDNHYCWTEDLAGHPVTEGLKRIYYPSANLRWDDCYTAPPLDCDDTWTPLVRSMPGARAATALSGQWHDEPTSPPRPILAATRSVGEGRLAVLSVHPAYLHRMGYQRIERHTWWDEMSYGLIDGMVLTQGDGQVPSDTGKLLLRLYAWLAGDSGAEGLGGYQAGQTVEHEAIALSEEEKNFQPVLHWDSVSLPPSWRHRPSQVRVGNETYYPELSDPLAPGEVQFFKGLVGAHTALSDGKGSVADQAAAAREAGYSLLVFTESLAHMSPEKWDRLTAACEENSSDRLVCLPGLDMADPYDNRFLVLAPPFYPRPTWLSPDGKRLVKTQVLNLLYCNHMVVAHRPSAGSVPYQRIKHFQGLSVVTYRDGKLVDDGRAAYAWLVRSGSNPHPIAVHEVFSPEEITLAAKTGFQQILPGDTLDTAVGYFRTGLGHFFEAPARYLISEGPILTTWTILNKDIGPAEQNRRQFRVGVGATNQTPLRTICLYDGTNLLRRWLPRSAAFEATADFRHAQQYGLWLMAEDSEGRRAIANGIRTVVERHHFRCGDRQNWLGAIPYMYAGAELPHPLNVYVAVKGTQEGRGVFTGVPGTALAVQFDFPFTANDVQVTDFVLAEKYVTASSLPDVGLDATPSFPSEPSTVYEGRIRYWSFTPGPGTPAGQHGLWPAMVEYDISLKRDVEPEAPESLFPTFGSLNGRKYWWPNPNGALASGDVPAQVTPLPFGGLTGNTVPLMDGLFAQGGSCGLIPPARAGKTTYPAGTRFTARVLVTGGINPVNPPHASFADAPEAWLRAMGFAGPTPYTLRTTRGRLDRIAFIAEFGADQGGVAGTVERAAEIPYLLPVRVADVNERWPTGVWRAGQGVTYCGVFQGGAWGRLDVSQAGAFYAGNVLMADDPDLVLSVVKWTDQAARIQAHNPTDRAMETTVASPPEITGLKAVKIEVSVPAGSSVYAGS